MIFIVMSSIAFGSQMYSDISEEHWAYRAIENLYKNGILPKDSASFDGEKKLISMI